MILIRHGMHVWKEMEMRGTSTSRWVIQGVFGYLHPFWMHCILVPAGLVEEKQVKTNICTLFGYLHVGCLH